MQATRKAGEGTADLKHLGVCVGVRMEGNFTHGMGNLSILHEAVPHKTATQVFCHQHTDTHIDANHIVAVPPSFRLEGIGKSVASLKLIAKSFPHR